MPPSFRQTPSTNRADEIDSNSNSNSNFNSNQTVTSRSSQPQHQHRASSTSTSASNSPVPTQVSTPPPQHGYYSPSHSYSHSHINQHQHSHTHPGMNIGLMQSVSPSNVGPIPGAPFYYHPYSLYPPHTHAPSSHGHHGPPPPHPPAPPAPPRANRNNSSGNPSTSTSGSPDPRTGNADRIVQNETPHSRPNTTSTSYSTSSNSSRTLHSAFPTSDMTRPQLVPTFSYYRNQANYDRQHHGLAGASQPEGRGKGKGKQNASSVSVDVDNAEFEDDGNDEEGGDDDDDDNTNDNDNDMGNYDYDEPMPMNAMNLGMELDLDPALVPASSVMPSSSSDPNTLFRGTEKRSNHEYYPSPHHQAHFRELMMADPSTPLSDPPISLNSLVDSEPSKKPAYPLPTIIRCAILGSPRQQLTLSELYLAMQRRFSYYNIGDGKSWRNSVRHNLSLNNLFQKVTRPITEPGKGCYWVVAHDKPPGNKRERKRNKKLGKRALAAMEREKAAAAAAGGMGEGRTDDDEGDGVEDDDNSGDVEGSTSPSSSSRRGRAAPTANTAPFPPYPQTSAVASTTILPSTTMTRPLFPFSRGTVAPNEGSYAAVTGVVPMPSQVPLPPNFGANMGARGYSTSTQFGVASGGPFSAFATTAPGTPAFGPTFGSASAGFEHSLDSSNTNLPTMSTSSAHRASSNFAINASKGKGKGGSANGRVIPIPTVEGGGNGGKGGGTMSQRSSSQNQDSGAMNLSQTGSSQELGSASGMGGMTPTQATSIQTSQSQGLGRVSTPSAAFSPAPSSSSSLPSTTFLQQPLSAQSSFSSTGFSASENVGLESHRTSRQNPVRRFDAGGSHTSIANPSLSLAQNRPLDTFNTLAAQIASEFRPSSNPNDNPLASVETTRTDIGSTLRSRTAPGPRPVTQPPRKKRATLRRDSGSEGNSESERSQEDDVESDEDDGDEYVPSRTGPGRRIGRRR